MNLVCKNNNNDTYEIQYIYTSYIFLLELKKKKNTKLIKTCYMVKVIFKVTYVIVYLDINKASKSNTSKSDKTPNTKITFESENSVKPELKNTSKKLIVTDAIGSPTLTDGIYISCYAYQIEL